MNARTPRTRRSRLGATLAEGIVAMLISGLFLSVLPAFYQSSVKVWQRESSELSVAETADFALKRMEEDVRNARSVYVSTSGLEVVLTQPLQAYDSELGRKVNVLADGWLVNGDRVEYYFVHNTATGSTEGAIYRRVLDPDGVAGTAVVVADHIQPTINPLDASTAAPLPVFSFDSVQRTLTVTITAAEPKPSSGTFAPTETLLNCARDGGQLYRVPTDGNPDGELRCSVCGEQLETSGEIVTYQTQFLVRNQ
jgi:Tfp pilus assembly protein PilW